MNKRCGLLSVTKRNGLKIQWGGKQQSDSTEGMRQYFPISFTTLPIVTANSNSQNNDFRGIQERTLIYFKCDTNSGYSNKKYIYWIAIGY